MRYRHYSKNLAAIVCAAVVTVATSVNARAQGEDLPTLVKMSIEMMQQENWAEALKLNAQAIQDYGSNAPTIYGPRFGGIYFRKGFCELKLKMWDDAMKSFEACYKDFPNVPGAKSRNDVEKRALAVWAEAAMGAGNWQLALDQFQKFLKERDKKNDPIPQSSFYVNLAICYANVGKIPESIENLEIAVKNKQRFETPDEAIVSAFQALVSGVVATGNEQALLDFMVKNRGEIIIDPYAMQRFAGLFMKLAADAIGAGMERAAMELYQFVPSTELALEDTKARVEAIGKIPRFRAAGINYDGPFLATRVEALEQEIRSGKSLDTVKLAALAFLHERHGNIRGAYAVYKQLEAYYPNSEKREDNLFNLIRTSYMAYPNKESLEYAQAFVKRFPASKYASTVNRMMLASLFSEGDYELCIESAASIINTLKSGTPEHDLCLHVLGGSYFYTGQYDKAQSWLDDHVKEYPNSMFVIASNYFQASNTYRLQIWSKAGELLDKFIAKYPDPSTNPFLTFALFDRANCYYWDEKYDRAMENANLLLEKYKDSKLTAQVHNLKGNIHIALEQPLEAEASFVAGLKLAENKQNSSVAGESLFALVDLLVRQSDKQGQPSRLNDALIYVDKFWSQYSQGSPYAKSMALVQLPVMEAAGRLDDALKQIQQVISVMAKDPQAQGLEEVIATYTEAYLKKYTPEQLKDHYYEFPDVSIKDRAARALLRIAVIGVYEDVAKSTPEEDRRRAANAMIKVLFQQLKSEFAVKDLSNYILVKVGDYLRQKTATPREALPFYDEVINRKEDASYRFAALLGRADIYGHSNNEADLEKSMQDFQRIFDDSEDSSEKEFSLYRMIELLLMKKDFEKAAELANQYLDKKTTGFSKYAPEVGLYLAQTFEGRKMTSDAIAMHTKVWSANMGNIKISAPAITAWMTLLWDRNQPAVNATTSSDRQGAYEGGYKYIELTGRFKDKMKESDLALWKDVEKLVKQYEANPNIKSMEQIKKEKEAARGAR